MPTASGIPWIWFVCERPSRFVRHSLRRVAGRIDPIVQLARQSLRSRTRAPRLFFLGIIRMILQGTTSLLHNFCAILASGNQIEDLAPKGSLHTAVFGQVSDCILTRALRSTTRYRSRQAVLPACRALTASANAFARPCALERCFAAQAIPGARNVGAATRLRCRLINCVHRPHPCLIAKPPPYSDRLVGRAPQRHDQVVSGAQQPIVPRKVIQTFVERFSAAMRPSRPLSRS